MTSFVRPSPWLRQLFTQSRTEALGPSRVSDDVSLTAPYDGGGWSLSNPESYISTAANAAADAGALTVLDIPENQLFRWMGASAVLSAGVAPTVTLDIQSIPSNLNLAVSNVITVNGTTHVAFSLLPPIVPPTMRIRALWLGGDAATIIVVRLYGTLLPLGTSPTI